MPGFCKCPYLPCPLRDNCQACIAKSRKAGTLCNCMEDIAIAHGATPISRYPSTLLCADSAGVAQHSARLIQETLAQKPDALLCLPAGHSALETFALLINMAKTGEIDFSRARFVQLDEWLDLPDLSQNCVAFMDKSFYGPAGIQPEQLFKFNAAAPDLAAECARIDAYLAAQGPIDLMLLGLGMNGHLGFNEPGVDWDQRATVVTLDETTQTVGQKYFEGDTKITRGLTLGMRYVYEAKKVVLQVSGEHKKDIVYEIYSNPPHYRLPGTVMQLLGEGAVVLDEAAAVRLDREKLAKAAVK